MVKTVLTNSQNSSSSARDLIYPSANLRLQKHCIHTTLFGRLLVGSLHKSNVIHCVSTNDTWKTKFLCVINRSAISNSHTKVLWERFCFHYIRFMQEGPCHYIAIFPANYLCNDFGGGYNFVGQLGFRSALRELQCFRQPFCSRMSRT